MASDNSSIILFKHHLQPRRTPTGAIKGVTIKEIENLKKTAIVSLKSSESVQTLTREFEQLQRKCDVLEQKQSSIIDMIKKANAKSRLQEKGQAFKILPDDVQKQFL